MTRLRAGSVLAVSPAFFHREEWAQKTAGWCYALVLLLQSYIAGTRSFTQGGARSSLSRALACLGPLARKRISPLTSIRARGQSVIHARRCQIQQDTLTHYHLRTLTLAWSYSGWGYSHFLRGWLYSWSCC